MGKPAHLSNKRWNKKFQKNVRKFQNIANQSRMNNKDSPVGIARIKQWAIIQCFLSFIKVVPLAVNQFFTKLTSTFTQMNNNQLKTEIDTASLEARVNSLEKALEEYADRMKTLQQEVERTSNQQNLYGHPHIPPPPQSLVQSTINLNVPTSFPPPPPPPPPPMGIFTVQNQLVIKKTSSTVKKPAQKPLLLRPSISVEDIMSVKLKKTPSVSRSEKTKVSTPSTDFHHPRISLEAIRSVKLKKTSLMKGPSPVKVKSPKNKMIVRHALRRLPVNLTPVGTPKGGRSGTPVISDQDDMTPVLTRALLKRFDAFQMSPDENKENDMLQFA